MMAHDTLPAASTRDLATMPIEQALDAYAPNFAAVLPPNITVDHFKRMVVTAININPELMNADRRTLFNSCVKCASDGLLPDGREAALVIYKTKVKDRQGREQWIEAVQFMPMVAGIRKRLRNSGEVDSATAEVVYRKDRFKYRLGDGAFIAHEPPPLDEDRGDAIGAYAIIKLTSGETIREVMGIKEIEKARAVSRAKDSAAGPWVKWWSEMARKTVLRRAAKAAPQAATLEKLLMRDEETDGLPAPEDLPAIPARPRRESFALPPAEYAAAPVIPTYPVVDLDGVETEWETPEEAEAYLEGLLRAASRRGLDRLNGCWESNDPGGLDGLPRAAIDRLQDIFDTLRASLANPEGHREGNDATVTGENPPHAPEDEEDPFGLKPLPARGGDTPETRSPAGASTPASTPATGKDEAIVDQAAVPTAAGERIRHSDDMNDRVLAGLAAKETAGPRDLLGGAPENLAVPWHPQDGSDLFVRQLDAMLAEAPLTAKRAATIRLRNRANLDRLAREAPDDHARLWGTLAEAR